MPGNLIEKKQALREQIRAALKAIVPSHRVMASPDICSRLQQQKIWNTARTILFFAPLPDEPDIWPLLEQTLAAGKTTALPRFLPETQTYVACEVRDLQSDVHPGKFGIREPVGSCREIAWHQMELVLVPGVAFDLDGRRLGRGRGFYDRLLAAAHGTKCGVAFEEQIVSEIPVEPLDARVNCIVTPTRWIEI